MVNAEITEKSMRISIIIYSLGGGGAERVVSQIIPYLDNKNVEVFLVLMNSTMKYEFEMSNNPYYLENSNPNEFGLLKFIKIPLLAFKYHLFLRNNKIDLSLAFLTRPSFISIISKIFNPRTKVIISERSCPSKQYGYRNLQSYLNALLIRKLYPKANLIISNSKGNADDLIQNFGIPENLLKTIYNPVDLVKINSVDPVEYFYEKDYFNLISVGRLDNGKNHVMMIKSMKYLKSYNIRLYIFGIGELFEKLSKLIVDLQLTGKVFLMGFVPNPYKYMKGADLFVFSSNHEGFPNVVLEAMTCNLPVISTNCASGPREILEAQIAYDCEDNVMTQYGILVPLNNQEKFAEAILEMVNNKCFYNSCKLNLKKRVRDFDSEKILEEFYVIINSYR